MSAKGRQGNVFDFAKAENANPREWYRTPSSCVDAIVPHLGLPRSTIDLGCGDGAIGKALRAHWGPGCTIDGFEIDAKRAAVARESGCYDDIFEGEDGNILTLDTAAFDGADVVISNPAFSHAEGFARQALRLVRPGGVVAFLLRLGWLASRSRVAFHREHPCDVYVLPKRPSFTGNGKSDSADYFWALWGLGRGGRWAVPECDPAPNPTAVVTNAR